MSWYVIYSHNHLNVLVSSNQHVSICGSKKETLPPYTIQVVVTGFTPGSFSSETLMYIVKSSAWVDQERARTCSWHDFRSSVAVKSLILRYFDTKLSALF